MPAITALRSNHWLFNITLLFSGFTFMLVWLPLLRCLMDGTSYRWGQMYFNWPLASEGLQVDYLFLVISLALYAALFYTSYWYKRRVVFYLLLIWWWVHVFGNLIYQIQIQGDTMFHGDTLDVHVSLKSIVYPLALLGAILVLAVIHKDQKLPTVQISWDKTNKVRAVVILAPLVLQVFLFSLGPPHGTSDQIGVVIAIMQSFLIPTIFWPARKKSV